MSLAHAGDDDPSLTDVLVKQPGTLTPFTLTDQHGAAFTEQRLRGHWTLLFLGYTNCPDVCPTTLAELDKTTRLIAPTAPPDDVQVVLVSVDPERDTPSALAQYLAYFNAQFVGLSGDHDTLHALGRQLNLRYQRGDTLQDGYTVHHSSAVALLDPQGRYVARFPAPLRSRTLARQLQDIRQQHRGKP